MSAFDAYKSAGYLRLNPAAHTDSDASTLSCVLAWNDLLGILLDAISFSSDENEVERS